MEGPEFEDLLTYLRISGGFDFVASNRTTARTAFKKRMQVGGSTTNEDNLDHVDLRVKKVRRPVGCAVVSSVACKATGVIRSMEEIANGAQAQ